VIAWDGDEIAGAVINGIDAEENEALDRRRGLLDSVFVRVPGVAAGWQPRWWVAASPCCASAA
jgi:hypothetical protein